MVIVKVTRNYQITIPAEIRKIINIKEGDYVEIRVEKDKIIIKKKEARRKRIKLGKKLTPEEIEEVIERGLKECVQ